MHKMAKTLFENHLAHMHPGPFWAIKPVFCGGHFLQATLLQPAPTPLAFNIVGGGGEQICGCADGGGREKNKRVGAWTLEYDLCEPSFKRAGLSTTHGEVTSAIQDAGLCVPIREPPNSGIAR
jgi:hypothetical protein